MNRIREIRQKKGMTIDELAQVIGVSSQQIGRLEKGQRRLTIEWMNKIAEVLQCKPFELVSEDSIEETETVPIVGYVGGGERFYTDEADHQGFTVPPPNLEHATAVQVKGNSMFPAYRNGDLLFYEPSEYVDEAKCLGQDCVLELRDGRAYIKRMLRGCSPGTYRLASYSGEEIDDAEVRWASPVLWVQRKAQSKLDR